MKPRQGAVVSTKVGVSVESVKLKNKAFVRIIPSVMCQLGCREDKVEIISASDRISCRTCSGPTLDLRAPGCQPFQPLEIGNKSTE